MSAVPSEIKRNFPALKPCQSMIVGRIETVDRTDTACFTTIVSPAPDAYSHPANHKVQSVRPLGRAGDDIEVLVELGGFKRSYLNKQNEKVFTVDNSLRAVE